MADLAIDLRTLRRLTTFSAKLQLSIVDTVGGGKDGSVFKTSRHTALKLFDNDTIYRKELAAYRVLREKRVQLVNQFKIPWLMSWHNGIRAIEMTLVRPPFIVDFASAILDEDWRDDDQLEQQLRERVEELFDERALDVFSALERLATLHGVHLLDAHPANIKFE